MALKLLFPAEFRRCHELQFGYQLLTVSFTVVAVTLTEILAMSSSPPALGQNKLFSLWLQVSHATGIKQAVVVLKLYLCRLNMSDTISLSSVLPWYNRTGWLGVKHQVTYLPTYSWVLQFYCLCHVNMSDTTSLLSAAVLLSSSCKRVRHYQSVECCSFTVFVV